MRSLWKIAVFWDENGAFGAVDLDGTPFCFRCLREVSRPKKATPRKTWDAAGPSLDRAHLIDRAVGGLDGPQNLVPLCRQCHAVQPVFEPGDEDYAIDWVRAGRSLHLSMPEASRIAAGLDTRVSDWPGAPREILLRFGIMPKWPGQTYPISRIFSAAAKNVPV